jgi:hypothetical protein
MRSTAHWWIITAVLLAVMAYQRYAINELSMELIASQNCPSQTK